MWNGIWFIYKPAEIILNNVVIPKFLFDILVNVNIIEN